MKREAKAVGGHCELIMVGAELAGWWSDIALVLHEGHCITTLLCLREDQKANGETEIIVLVAIIWSVPQNHSIHPAIVGKYRAQQWTVSVLHAVNNKRHGQLGAEEIDLRLFAKPVATRGFLFSDGTFYNDKSRKCISQNSKTGL